MLCFTTVASTRMNLRTMVSVLQKPAHQALCAMRPHCLWFRISDFFFFFLQANKTPDCLSARRTLGWSYSAYRTRARACFHRSADFDLIFISRTFRSRARVCWCFMLDEAASCFFSFSYLSAEISRWKLTSMQKCFSANVVSIANDLKIANENLKRKYYCTLWWFFVWFPKVVGALKNFCWVTRRRWCSCKSVPRKFFEMLIWNRNNFNIQNGEPYTFRAPFFIRLMNEYEILTSIILLSTRNEKSKRIASTE